MAESIVFNGFEIFQPGAYSKADLSALIRARVEGGGNIAVVGTAKGGEPNKVHHLSDPQQARLKFRKNSVLWEAIRLMYVGDNIHTASNIYAVRVGNALKGQRETYCLTEKGHITKFVSRDWGSWVNGTGVRVQIIEDDTYFLPDPDDAPVLSNSVTGGSIVGIGYMYFKYAFVNKNGETMPSPAANINVPSGTTNKLTVSLLPHVTVWPVGAYKIYLYASLDNGVTYFKQAELSDGATLEFQVTAWIAEGERTKHPVLASTARAFTLNIYTYLQNGNTAIQQYENILTQADMIARVNADAARDIGSVTAQLIKAGELDHFSTSGMEGGSDGEAAKAFGYYYTFQDDVLGEMGDSPSLLRFEAYEPGAEGVGIEIRFEQDYIDEPLAEPAVLAEAHAGATIGYSTLYITATYENALGETVSGRVMTANCATADERIKVTVKYTEGQDWQLDADGAIAALKCKIYASHIPPNPGQTSVFSYQGVDILPPATEGYLETYTDGRADPTKLIPTVNGAQDGYRLKVSNGAVTEYLRMFNDIGDVVDWSCDSGNTPRSTLINVQKIFGTANADIQLALPMSLHDGVDQSPTPTHYQDALDLLRYERVHILHPAGVIEEAIHNLFREHCHFMSNTVQRRERVCIVGAGALESIEQLCARASVQNSGRMQIVAPGMTTYNDNGVLTEYSGAYLAAQKCGISAGLDISEPSTHKYLPGCTALSKTFLYSEIDDLIRGGVCVAELDKDTGAFRIVRDITTWLIDNTYAEFTIQRIVDNLSINMRRSLEQIAVGKGITRTLLSRVKNETKRVLEDHKRRDIIFDWANIIVEHDFDQIFVSYQVAPVFPANFVLITQYFVPHIVDISNKVEEHEVMTANGGFAPYGLNP